MNMPGFAAEISLHKSYERHQVAAKEADHSGEAGVIPQYCHCRAVGTLQIGPTGVPVWGPPYHTYCYGGDCWRPRFGSL
jgi:hypothetical protein